MCAYTIVNRCTEVIMNTYMKSSDKILFVLFIGWLMAVIPYAAGFPISLGRLARSRALFRELMKVGREW